MLFYFVSNIAEIFKLKTQKVDSPYPQRATQVCKRYVESSTVTPHHKLRCKQYGETKLPANNRGRNSCKKAPRTERQIWKWITHLSKRVGRASFIKNQRGKISLSCPFKEFRTDARVHSYVQPIVRKPIYITHSKMGLLQSQENVVLIAL